ncbi:MAG: threonine synthase [Deltaproteobacteria bacterium]|nr:threonine synthase [Deltaproteobacteria bacterium]
MRPAGQFGTALRCVRCGSTCEPSASLYVCTCGGNLLVEYDLAAARGALTRKSLAASSDHTLWRYLPLLPVSHRLEGPPVGWTPMVEAAPLARELGVQSLWIKDDGRNPSASFKDRASSVALQRARELGHPLVTGASTGNAASATAVLCAAIGMKARIFVPKTAPRAKIAQLLTFGAEVLAVDGTYDQAFDLCLEATRRFGWYNRNTGYNPYTREGKKTVSFEILEQLGWTVPDLVVVPVGDGNILTGVWKGFVEAKQLGLVDRTPRLLAVQAEGSAAIVQALRGDGTIRPVSGDTVADSISVSLPRDGEAAVQAVRASDGFAVTVSDQAILQAILQVARGAGVFAEPAAAASWAGLKAAKAQELIRPEWKIVSLNTGNGLKDVASAMKVAGEPKVILPDPEVLEKLFGA